MPTFTLRRKDGATEETKYTELDWWARQAGFITVMAHGSTLLEAAMRCIVMSFVGNTMPVPEELL